MKSLESMAVFALGVNTQTDIYQSLVRLLDDQTTAFVLMMQLEHWATWASRAFEPLVRAFETPNGWVRFSAACHWAILKTSRSRRASSGRWPVRWCYNKRQSRRVKIKRYPIYRSISFALPSRMIG